jgi:hypothetical protein
MARVMNYESRVWHKKSVPHTSASEFRIWLDDIIHCVSRHYDDGAMTSRQCYCDIIASVTRHHHATPTEPRRLRIRDSQNSQEVTQWNNWSIKTKNFIVRIYLTKISWDARGNETKLVLTRAVDTESGDVMRSSHLRFVIRDQFVMLQKLPVVCFCLQSSHDFNYDEKNHLSLWHKMAIK